MTTTTTAAQTKRTPNWPLIIAATVTAIELVGWLLGIIPGRAGVMTFFVMFVEVWLVAFIVRFVWRLLWRVTHRA